MKNDNLDSDKKKSAISSILSALFVGGFTFYFLFTGLFDFLISSLSHGFWEAVIGIFVMIAALFFAFGSLWTIFSEYNVFRKNKISKNNKDKNMYLVLFLGLLPVLFAIGLGQIDFYVIKISKVVAIILIPVIFSPLIFAKKLGSSFFDVFYGLIFWLLLVLIYFSLFGKF